MSMKNGTDKHKGGGRDTGEGVVDHGGTGRLMGKLFWEFLKLGLFTIGGGMAMIPQMQRLASEDNRWLSREEVVDCIALSQSLPGIIAINMATYIGRRICGIRGAVAATTGVVLPSFVIILAAVLALGQIGDNPWLAGAFLGVKAAVCGLILVTAVRLGRQILRSPFHWVLMIGSLIAIGFLGINAVWVVLAGALAGIIRCLIVTREEKPGQTGEGGER